MDGASTCVWIELDSEGGAVRPGDQIPVSVAGRVTHVQIPSLRELFAEKARPIDFATRDRLLRALDRTVTDYGVVTGKPPTQRELTRILDLWSRHPDAWDRNPLLAYLQAAARLFLTMHPVAGADLRAAILVLAKEGLRAAG